MIVAVIVVAICVVAVLFVISIRRWMG